MPTKLADRVTAIERELAALKAELANAPPSRAGKDWRKTIGLFANDPFYDETVERGAAYRRRQPRC